MVKLNTVQQNREVYTNNFLGCRSFEIAWHTTIALCAVGELVFRQHGYEVKLKN